MSETFPYFTSSIHHIYYTYYYSYYYHYFHKRYFTLHLLKDKDKDNPFLLSNPTATASPVSLQSCPSHHAPSWRLSSLNQPPPDPCPSSCRAPHPTKQSSSTFRNNHTLTEMAMATAYSIGSLQTLGQTGRHHTQMATALCPFPMACLTRFRTEAPDTEVP